MKIKHYILLLVHLILIGFLILNGNLHFKDVIFVYLIVLIPAYVLLNLEYLLRRKHLYSQYILNKLFTNFLIIPLVFGFIIFLTSPRYISRESAVHDLNFMVSSLENVHPDIYHTISKDSFLVELTSTIDGLPEKLTELEFYKLCAKLDALFGTGHTKPRMNILFSRLIVEQAFPYRTKIIDNKLFVTENLILVNRIPIGSEIITINGKDTDQLITEWSNLVSYENTAFRNYTITKPFTIGIWNDFKSYNIEYLDYKSKQIEKKTVNGSVLSNMYSFLKNKINKPKKLFFKELSPGIGYIGFFDCHDLKNYKQFFQSAFDELKSKKIHNLIIDIRDNGGGHTIIGAELMQYISHQPFKEIDSAIVKVSNELIATGKVKRKLGAGKKEIGKTYTRIPEPYQLRENPLRFEGNTYLLTNNGTYSAGQGFASAYRCFGNGTIIGEETGGVTVGFGDVHIFELPNTGLEIMTSWEQAFSACGIDNRRGVIPDYIISNTVEDCIQKKDRALEFTIDLINRE